MPVLLERAQIITVYPVLARKLQTMQNPREMESAYNGSKTAGVENIFFFFFFGGHLKREVLQDISLESPDMNSRIFRRHCQLSKYNKTK